MKFENKPTCKGFIAGILESKRIGNCSNGGISSFHDTVTIVSDEAELKVFETYPSDELRRPIVIIKKSSNGHIFAEPIDKPKGFGWMMGGTFIWSSDSRFRKISGAPIPLHDRQETPEQNRLLST